MTVAETIFVTLHHLSIRIHVCMYGKLNNVEMQNRDKQVLSSLSLLFSITDDDLTSGDNGFFITHCYYFICMFQEFPSFLENNCLVTETTYWNNKD